MIVFDVEEQQLSTTTDFDALFETAYPSLVRALTMACGDAEVAADAVQDAFVKAHLRWRRISTYDDPAGWVRRVAINRINDHFRREARGERARRRMAPLHEDAAMPEPLPDLAGALRRLPPQQRLAMSLYYLNELSVAQVASAMQLSEGAVKYHLHQGRAGLRPLIGDGSDQQAGMP
ncbi:MAG: sigma-70 family RNA polymerase sigma factor [Acidimicrobiia bacterium]